MNVSWVWHKFPLFKFFWHQANCNDVLYNLIQFDIFLILEIYLLSCFESQQEFYLMQSRPVIQSQLQLTLTKCYQRFQISSPTQDSLIFLENWRNFAKFHQRSTTTKLLTKFKTIKKILSTISNLVKIEEILQNLKKFCKISPKINYNRVINKI